MLRLIEVLELINESCNVNVYDADTRELLSYYDGKNSIDANITDWFIMSIDNTNNSIDIYIDNPTREI